MVECSTWDRGVDVFSLPRGTILFPCARHVILYLVLVQPRICTEKTEFFWLGCKVSTSNNRGPQLLSVSVLDTCFGEGSMMELSNVLFSAEYWFSLVGQGNVGTWMKKCWQQRKISIQTKQLMQNNKRDPYLKTLLQLCASTGTQGYL